MFVVFAASAAEVPFDASLDEVPELERALEDLLDGESLGSSASYWERIKERLLHYSSTSRPEEAVEEWAQDGSPWAQQQGMCELCDHTPIVFHFPIRNRVTGARLVVGSECMHNYLKINGVEGRDHLKKKVEAQIKVLKRKLEGKATEEDYATAEEVVDLEQELRARLQAVAPDDLDVAEYRNALLDAQQVGAYLKVGSVGYKSAEDALKASRALVQFQDEISKRQRKYKGHSLKGALDAILRQKSNDERVANLQRLRRLMSDLFTFGRADEVTSRMWGAIEARRDGLVDEVGKKADEAKAKLVDQYSDELALAKPYPHLHFTLQAGIETHKKAISAQAEASKDTLRKPDFFEVVRKTRIGPVVNMKFYPDLAYATSVMSKAGHQVAEFLNSIDRGVTAANKAIKAAFGIEQLRDTAGVRIAVLRAADDGIVDADTDGAATIGKFADLVVEKEPRVLLLVEEEVDDVKERVRATAGLRNFQVMGEALGFDVSRAFRLFTTDSKEDQVFCAKLVKTWRSGKKLSPSDMGTVKRRMAANSRVKEVDNSVWARFRVELTAPYRAKV